MGGKPPSKSGRDTWPEPAAVRRALGGRGGAGSPATGRRWSGAAASAQRPRHRRSGNARPALPVQRPGHGSGVPVRTKAAGWTAASARARSSTQISRSRRPGRHVAQTRHPAWRPASWPSARGSSSAMGSNAAIMTGMRDCRDGRRGRRRASAIHIRPEGLCRTCGTRQRSSSGRKNQRRGRPQAGASG
jgi:hypothetical protein